MKMLIQKFTIIIIIIFFLNNMLSVSVYYVVYYIVHFLGSRQMDTAPTSIEVLLRPTQSQSDKRSDLRGSLSPTTRHRCTIS